VPVLTELPATHLATTSRLADRLAAGWALVVALLLVVVFRGHGFDDPYITYRYAANLAAGEGFVYNPGERVLSTTAPLYGLLLAPAAAAGLDLPLVSNALGCLSLGAGALAFWWLGRLAALPIAGGVAALLYPLSPQLVFTLGAETSFFIALALWGFVAIVARRPVWAGLLMAGASLARADAALAAAVGALGVVLAGGWRAMQRYAAVYLLAMTPFLAVAWAYFGAPLPATLGAKRSQAHIPGSRSYASGLLGLVTGLAGQPLFWPLFGLAPLGLVAGLRRRGPLLLPLAWGLLHAAAYSLLGVTAYFWYYGPAVVALVAAAALGAAVLAEWLRALAGARLGTVALAALVGAVLVGQVLALGAIAARPDARLALYREAGRWLATNTAPGARVGALEVGVIGYYSGRPMVDFAGLIQPELAQVFRAGGDYGVAARQAIATLRPAYLVSQEAALPLVTAEPALAARCAPVAAFADGRYPAPLRIYRCTWP